jgi:hypothetical protein
MYSLALESILRVLSQDWEWEKFNDQFLRTSTGFIVYSHQNLLTFRANYAFVPFILLRNKSNVKYNIRLG